MEQQITVYDEKNAPTGITFRRRAKQLVAKGRAIWLDETLAAIRLIPAEPEQEEEIAMEITLPPNNPAKDGYGTAYVSETEASYDKESLMRLAKKKVKDRKSLIRHIIIYIVAWPVLIMLFTGSYAGHHSGYSYGVSVGFTFGILLTWGIFLMHHMYTYFSPYFGSLKLFKRHKMDPVEAEYKKLKRMDPDRIELELRNL